MNHASLFTGIGGFDLGFERVGIHTAWQVEIDPFCQRVLAKHFPAAQRYTDIRSVHGVLSHTNSTGSRGKDRNTLHEGRAAGEDGRARLSQNTKRKDGASIGDAQSANPDAACPSCLASVDIITGGFPCQPFSVAGKRHGREDDRYLWPAMLRIIKEVRPRWVVAENVPGLITMAEFESVPPVDTEGVALAKEGDVHRREGRGVGETILASLESLGYTVGAVTIPACAVDAAHKRERLWIVAHTSQHGCESNHRRQSIQDQNRNRQASSSRRTVQQSRATSPGADVADPERAERRTQPQRRDESHWHDAGRQEASGGASQRGQDVVVAYTTSGSEQSGGAQRDERRLQKEVLRTRRDSYDWTTEPAVGRVAYGVPDRVDRLRALGNAIVPQIAEEIGRMILAVDWA